MEDETALSSPLADQPVPQLALAPVDAAQPIVRASDGRRSVVLAGSGAGVVDAAAAGLLDRGRAAALQRRPDGGGRRGTGCAPRRHRQQPQAGPPVARVAGHHRLHRGRGRRPARGRRGRPPPTRVRRGRRRRRRADPGRAARLRSGRRPARTASPSRTGPRTGPTRPSTATSTPPGRVGDRADVDRRAAAPRPRPGPRPQLPPRRAAAAPGQPAHHGGAPPDGGR